jgi:hypothetical protein
MAQVTHYSEHNNTALYRFIQLFPALTVLGNKFFTADSVVFQVAVNKAWKINVVLLFIDQSHQSPAVNAAFITSVGKIGYS